ncbi:hypothetical protein [Streptomyces sp. NBC_00878]|uniref:hypothetical protein n=1 Tax=Streptomyces sp. NBC_00878 TaxID=2975854 RepID=UPI002252020F|nr:hypothetical protein [Streptomyces sp. NBC_00878]MCX4911805.1 hypothetical protein [Streptomyces sp. NBC_00878]
MATPSEPQARGVRIDAQPGHATIALDGTPLSDGLVTGYVLEHDIAASLPRLVLHTRHPKNTAFEGLAQVAVGVSQTPGDIVAAFLAQVDPVLLDQESLNRSDYGGGPGATARSMLAVLTEWARGGKAGD